jgi:hypothetical protein
MMRHMFMETTTRPVSVLHNTTNPESTLKKKSNSIAYHLCRESVAMDEMRVGYVKTDDNFAEDLMTKKVLDVQPKGERRERLLSQLADVGHLCIQK